MPGFKLGKLPARPSTRTLRFASYLDRGVLPSVPAAVDFHKAVTVPWGMLANDSIGDCAEAAPAHRAMAWTANATGKAAVFADGDVIKAYSQITGYVPGHPETDLGSDMLSVEKYMASTGIAGHKIDAFVSVNVADPAELRAAAWLFGGLNIGIQLPQAWQSVNLGGTWKGPISTRDLRGQWAAGSWGGHDIYSGKFDPNGFEVVTWGGVITATNTAITDYVDEVFVAISREWFDEAGHSPNSFNWSQLWADLADVTDGRVPIPTAPPNPFPPVPTPTPTPVPPVPVPGFAPTRISLYDASSKAQNYNLTPV